MKVNIQAGPSLRHKDGLLKISLRVPDVNVTYDLDLPFKELSRRCGSSDLIALDLLIVASLCYVIDKAVDRSAFSDNWTREFEVDFPVSDPHIWSGAATAFQSALNFLTGDIWQLSFTKCETDFFRRPRQRIVRRRRLGAPHVGKASKVCLFSGGLDSLSGAIDLLASSEDEKVFLTGHYDAGGPAAQQQRLFSEISRHYPRRVELQQVRVSHKPLAAEGNTLRSRSLVFLALGIYAARSFGKNVPLYAPENGFIALNIPLTPSRTSSCSTRTMHPFFLGRLAEALQKLGIENPIVNPFHLKTKGECIVQNLNRPLLAQLIDKSVSCSHGTRKQRWVRKTADNCGYCVPCLIRRAAVHQAGLDWGNKYGFDVCTGELTTDDPGATADDLRAVLDCLRSKRSVREIEREIRGIAPVPVTTEYAEMIERGFDEIRVLIHAKGTPALKRMAGQAGRR